MKTSLVQIRKGDSVIYEPNGRGIEVVISDYKLVPNGIGNPELVCLIVASNKEIGYTVEATSDKFAIRGEGVFNTVYEIFNTK